MRGGDASPPSNAALAQVARTVAEERGAHVLVRHESPALAGARAIAQARLLLLDEPFTASTGAAGSG